MMNFRDFIIEEDDDNEHKYGTFISVKPNKESIKKLTDWAIANKIPNILEDDKLHCTVIYSRKGISAAKHYDMNLPINAETSGLKIFTNGGEPCLVVTLKSKDLTAHHNTIMNKYGATYDYDTYHPHISLSYKLNGMDTSKLKFPKVDLVFDDMEFEKLDEPRK